ncbi:hypothetical protein AOL_s00054g717 [Orbilia oligospora ATCC 24927]|uniref:F-box domain-containing protein n=2 Tax=Orbilia oligospora TaxID=2813651 RepID=G1X773_ARTOA|nr:hypothetical protein AOL_s00054g717 [Orbilia oligospora ATCC 24927]EGX50981.1 hypothetical protein AOL_s00054g717 [Orbilia oligospora ATCC 24927]KAF3282670.1 hypothetical protein TWF970_001416 [Orbilia oligospora]
MESESKGPTGQCPSFIENIPLELLSEIIGFLDMRSDMISLLQTSKTMYYGTYPHFWRTFEPVFQDGAKECDLEKLLTITNEKGVNAMGFNHIKEIRFFSGHMRSSLRRLYVGEAACAARRQYDKFFPGELFDIFSDKLASGEMTLRRVRLHLVEAGCASESALNFLRVLKEYSKSNRLSIDATTDMCNRCTYARCLQIDAFALECFTHLQLPFLSSASLTTEHDTIEEIEVVVKILQLTKSLKQLELMGNKHAMDCDFPISKLPQLEDLQNAVTNLKYLKCLKVLGLIFHPSFFLIPPDSVTKLGLTQIVSISWWRKFAQCPLVNVTELKMKASYLGARTSREPSRWLGEDDKEANEAKDKNYKFFLGGLAMQNLRKFVSRRPYFYWPEDFWDLLHERNKGIAIEKK